jgi:pilus assembly protein Flp/PilA
VSTHRYSAPITECGTAAAKNREILHKIALFSSTAALEIIRRNAELQGTLGCQSEEYGMLKLVRFLRDDSGATAIEYGLIAAGISVAIIAVVQGLGSGLNTTFT